MNCVLKLKTKALQFHVANTSSTSMRLLRGREWVCECGVHTMHYLYCNHKHSDVMSPVSGRLGRGWHNLCPGPGLASLQTGFLSVAVQQSGGGCHCCCYSCEESCCCAVVLLEENTKAKTGCQIELWWQTLISGPAPTPALSAELCHVSAGAGSADCST